MTQQHPSDVYTPFFILVVLSCTAFVFVNMEETSFLGWSRKQENRIMSIAKGLNISAVNETELITAESKHPTVRVKRPSVDVDDAHWPELDTLIGDLGTNITGDVQFLLDFAIVGHPKTATTSTLQWLASQEEIEMFNREVYAMKAGHPAKLVSTLYDLKPGRYYKRGYKSPNDLKSPKALTAFAKYFPKTKLIVGVRHPVLWFESYYNFKARFGAKLPPAELLLGANKKGQSGVCTDGARFHLHLDNLGKTARSAKEQKLLSWRPNEKPSIPNMTNPVFIYEMNQLHDANKTRSDQYLEDLQHFLGLQNALTPVVRLGANKIKIKTIHICDKKYSALRVELMKTAREASTWILEFFLESRDVHLSSPEHFRELVQSWSIDPCALTQNCR